MGKNELFKVVCWIFELVSSFTNGYCCWSDGVITGEQELISWLAGREWVRQSWLRMVDQLIHVVEGRNNVHLYLVTDDSDVILMSVMLNSLNLTHMSWYVASSCPWQSLPVRGDSGVVRLTLRGPSSRYATGDLVALMPAPGWMVVLREDFVKTFGPNNN